MKKILVATLLLALVCAMFTGCMDMTATANTSNGTAQDTDRTQSVANKLQSNQPTPTDIDYSLERYNLVRRAYWVNGQREKANTYPCSVEKPLGYIVLITESGAIVGSFVVDGKVSSLNSFLTPDSEHYETATAGGEYRWVEYNDWLPDVDGSYGENDAGIFFFTPDGKYIEWTGTYLYSDIPFVVENPVVTIGG